MEGRRLGPIGGYLPIVFLVADVIGGIDYSLDQLRYLDALPSSKLI